MKINARTIYHLPTQAHEDDFLKQAEKQGFEWISSGKPSNASYSGDYGKDYHVEVDSLKILAICMGYEFSSLPIIEWEIEFNKSDMQIGQFFETRNGKKYSWDAIQINAYNDNLEYCPKGNHKPEGDIVKVYPSDITPMWEREIVKYRVKYELTQEQAEKLGLDLCEVIE